MPIINGLPAGYSHTAGSEQDTTFVTETVRGYIDASFVKTQTAPTPASKVVFLKEHTDRNVHDFFEKDKFIMIPAGAKVLFAVLYPLDEESYATMQTFKSGTTTTPKCNIGLVSTTAGVLPDPAWQQLYGAKSGTNPSMLVENIELSAIKAAPLYMITDFLPPTPRTTASASGMYVSCEFIQGNPSPGRGLRLGIHIEYMVMRNDIYSHMFASS